MPPPAARAAASSSGEPDPDRPPFGTHILGARGALGRAPPLADLKLSLSKEIAAKFGVKARQLVHARLVPRSSIDLDFVELIFGKPCVDSATIWDVREALRSECLYEGKRIYAGGASAVVKA